MRLSGLSRLVRAGLLTALTDGTFASVLSVFAYGSTVTRLWQGVASTLLAVVIFVVLRSRRVRELLDSPYGPAKVGALYGPFIWSVMSLVVIPLLVHRPPTIGARWWVQLIGHIPFVGIPIAAASRRSRSWTQ